MCFRGPGSEIIAETAVRCPTSCARPRAPEGVPGFALRPLGALSCTRISSLPRSTDISFCSVATTGTHAEPMAVCCSHASPYDRHKTASLATVEGLTAAPARWSCDPFVRDVLLKPFSRRARIWLCSPCSGIVFGWPRFDQRPGDRHRRQLCFPPPLARRPAQGGGGGGGGGGGWGG